MSEKNIEILKKMLPVKQSIVEASNCRLHPNEVKSITGNLASSKATASEKDDVKRLNTYQYSNTSMLNLLKVMSENVYTFKSIKLSEGFYEDSYDSDIELSLNNRNFIVNTGTLKRIGIEVKQKISTLNINEEDKDIEVNNCFDSNFRSKSSSTNDTDILGDLMSRYYYDISENISENFENYVVNNLTIISYLQEIIPKGEKNTNLSSMNLARVKAFDSSKKVLLLDLDETLIHSDFENQCHNIDAEINISVDNTSSCALRIAVRPHIREFLQFARSKFNVVLFTAGVQEYADPIVNYLDPLNEIFSLRLYRDSCFEFRNFFIKDLSILSGIDEKDMIIVDNCIFSFAMHLSNGYLISSFYENRDDSELLFLIDYLIKISASDSVKEVNENYYGLEALKEIMYNKLLSEGIIKLKK